jgi:hypothetical protein
MLSDLFWRDLQFFLTGNCGAVTGGIIGGWSSQFLGRRLAIIAMCIWTGAFIPLWILPTSFSGLALGAFFLQFGVQGAWGKSFYKWFLFPHMPKDSNYLLLVGKVLYRFI